MHDDPDEFASNGCSSMAMMVNCDQSTRPIVDGGQIERFARGIFAYADPGTYLSLRAFEERKPEAKPIINQSIPVGHDQMVAEAVRLALRAAYHDHPSVFCPPLATFKTVGTAKSVDLANGLVLSVECDSDPAEACRLLEAILGPATFVVASGGIWTNPATGERIDKLHLHWRLSEPTREVADHAKLREVRHLATLLAGADASNIPPVHPIRWPGTMHCKAEPRMASIVAETGNEIELGDAQEQLREAAAAYGIMVEPTAQTLQLTQSSAGHLVPASRVQSALHFINGWDEYKLWIDMGIYVKAALGDSGYDIWAEWSAQSQKFDDAEARATWATFNPIRTGGGQLFSMAEAAGWRWTPADDGVTIDLQGILESCHARQHHQHRGAEQAGRLLAEAAAANEDDPEPLKEPNIPEPTAPAGIALPEPAGLVREIRDHILDTARSPQPELALAAALTIVGSAMARRYSFENLRSNLYLVGVAPSTSGKEVPLTAVSRILADAGLADTLAGGEPKSGSAVLARLVEHPVAVYTLDEFGMLLRALTERNAPKHVREIIKYMTEIFTKADDSYRTGDYADRKANPIHTIIEPHLSIFGLTNSVHLWRSITADSVADGSLGRFLLFSSRAAYPDVNFEPKPKQTPPEIIEKLKAIHEQGGAPDAGNLAGISIVSPANTRDVSATREAQQLFMEAEIRQLELKRDHAGDGMSAIYGRLVENAKKLAMIHAVGRDPVQATVTVADAQWGLDSAAQLVTDLVKAIGAHVADNEREAASKRVLDLITKAGKKGIAKSDLTNRTQWLKQHERTEILDDLRTGGLVVFEVVQTNGRPRSVWRSLAG